MFFCLLLGTPASAFSQSSPLPDTAAAPPTCLLSTHWDVKLNGPNLETPPPADGNLPVSLQGIVSYSFTTPLCLDEYLNLEILESNPFEQYSPLLPRLLTGGTAYRIPEPTSSTLAQQGSFFLDDGIFATTTLEPEKIVILFFSGCLALILRKKIFRSRIRH